MANREHPCWRAANKALKADNTELDMRETVSMSTGHMSRALPIPTRKIDPRGKKARMLMPTFCPFCGEKL